MDVLTAYLENSNGSTSLGHCQTQHKGKTMIDKKHILITGASRGIGLAIARRLQKPSNALHLIARSITPSPELEDAYLYSIDLTNPIHITELQKKIERNTPKIDVLINNAGCYVEKSLEDTDIRDFDQLFYTNLRGPMLLTQALLPLLGLAKAPLIINVSSSGALNTGHHGNTHAVYAASKAALTRFSDAMREEFNRKHIRITTLHPAGVNTWNAENPAALLIPEDIAYTVQHVVDSHPRCQFSNIEMAAVDAHR